MNTSNNTEKLWLSLAAEIRDILVTLSPHNQWTTTQTIKETFEKVVKSIAPDLKHLKKEAIFLFTNADQTNDTTKQNVDFIQQWYQGKTEPSMLALCIYAAQHFKLKISNDLKKALILAAILGEVPNSLSYHNTKHYKKVLIQTIRLITTHNNLYQSQPQAYSDRDIATLMLTACIHDLGHDGAGNTADGEYKQARSERLSFNIAIKYFHALDYENKIDFKDLMDSVQTMILCTDTSPLGDKNSLVNHMKTIYRQHVQSQIPEASFKLDPELFLLKENPTLSTMALLLHEADMASSSSLSYEMTVFETASFYEEIGKDEARPENILEFIEIICNRQVLSEAGKKLYSQNMANIIKKAEQAIEEGNHPFPQPEKTPFVLGSRLKPQKP